MTSTDGKIGLDNVSSSLNIDSKEKLDNKNKKENIQNESINVIDDSKSRCNYLLFLSYRHKKIILIYYIIILNNLYMCLAVSEGKFDVMDIGSDAKAEEKPEVEKHEGNNEC